MDTNINAYPYEKKKRLAKKIGALKRKEDLVKVLEIIYADNKNITENQNGLFLFFERLNDATYHKIDLYLRSSIKKKISDDELSDKHGFVTYAKNEFSDSKLETLSDSKLKYSNREKNIIKRKNYSEHLNSENGINSHVTYSKFDLSVLSDSEKISDEKKDKVFEQISVASVTVNTDTETNTEPKEKTEIKKARGRPKKNLNIVV